VRLEFAEGVVLLHACIAAGGIEEQANLGSNLVLLVHVRTKATLAVEKFPTCHTCEALFSLVNGGGPADGSEMLWLDCVESRAETSMETLNPVQPGSLLYGMISCSKILPSRKMLIRIR